MPIVHDFKKSLDGSHMASDLPIWKEIYERAFPDMVAMVDHRDDGAHQRAGIDRSIVMRNSKQILIDEKIRWRDYQDIALEYWSDRDRQILGWVCKPLLADYICYAIAPSGKAYLLPLPQLQQAWTLNKEQWMRMYHSYDVLNHGYVTCILSVPVDVLFTAINACLQILFQPVL